MEQAIQKAKETIPPLRDILEEAWDKVKPKKDTVEKKFGEFCITLDETATLIFKDYEKKALAKLAELWLDKQRETIRNKLKEIIEMQGWEQFKKEASELFSDFGILVQRIEKDLGNMRKARGGRTFENILIKLFRLIDISCERPKGKKGEDLKRIDIVIPSIEVASQTPDKAIFLTCKRTLRERWKQEVPQARLNQRIYLLTIDNTLSSGKAKEIDEKGFIAFVRDELLNDKSFEKMAWIRRLSDLPSDLRKV